MKEKDFQKRIKASMTEQDIWCHNLADMPRSGENDGADGSKKTFRFIPEKPGDLFGAYKHFPFLIECKMIRKFGKISNTILQGSKDKRLGRSFDDWHQVKELDRFNVNGTSFLCLCVYLDQPRRYNFIVFIPWILIRDAFKRNDVIMKNEEVLTASEAVSHYRKGYDMETFKTLLLFHDARILELVNFPARARSK